MKRLELRCLGTMDLNPVLEVNGRRVKLKRNSFGSFVASCPAEGDFAEVRVSYRHELSCKLWWLFSAIFFVISFFGVFSPRYSRKTCKGECRFSVRQAGEGTASADIVLTGAGGERAAEISSASGAAIEETANRLEEDKKVRRRLAIIRVFRVAGVFAAAAALVRLFYALFV